MRVCLKDCTSTKKLLNEQELMNAFIKYNLENTKYGGKEMYQYKFQKQEENNS